MTLFTNQVFVDVISEASEMRSILVHPKPNARCPHKRQKGRHADTEKLHGDGGGDRRDMAAIHTAWSSWKLAEAGRSLP